MMNIINITVIICDSPVCRHVSHDLLVSLASSPPPGLVVSWPRTLLLLLLRLKHNVSFRDRAVGGGTVRSYSVILRILTLVLRTSFIVLTVYLRTIIFVIELLHVILLLRRII